MGTYDAIEDAVKRRRPTRPPKQDLALQAFVGAVLLSERQLGVDTLTTAARLVDGVQPPPPCRRRSLFSNTGMPISSLAC